MDCKTALAAAWVMVLLLVILPAFAVQQVTNPEISVHAYARRLPAYDKGEPLLIEVSIGNPVAANVVMENRQASRIEETYRQAGVLDRLSPTEKKNLKTAPLPVPSVKLGSDSTIINDLVSVSLQEDHSGKPPLKAHLLACSKNNPRSIVLDGDKSLAFYFGFDGSDLVTIKNGTYTVTAVLNSENKKEMWQGKEESHFQLPLSDHVSYQSPEQQQLALYTYGRYCLLDGQFDRVGKYAQRLLAIDKNSVAAAELQGDAALGRKDLKEAASAFQLALKRWQDRSKKIATAPVEPPTYILDRIAEVNRLMRLTKK